jgi:hypothetical protein
MGLLVAAMTAVSYRYFKAGHEILSDMPFVTCYWAAFLCVLRYGKGRKLWLLGAAGWILLACQVRLSGAVAIAALAAGVAVSGEVAPTRRKRLAASGTLLGATVAGALLFYALMAWWVGYGGHKRYTGRSSLAPSGFWDWVNQVGQLLGNTVIALAEAVSSQEFVPAGLLTLGLIFAYAWMRRGRARLAPVTLLAFVVGMFILAGGWSIRGRYILPVLPLALWAATDGLGCVAWKFRTLRGQPGRKVAAWSCIIFGSLVIASNLPKVLRWSVYYSWLSYRGGYYQVIRDGEYNNLFTVGSYLNDRLAPREPAALTTHTFSILCYVSDRPMEPMTEEEPIFAEQAEASMQTWRQSGLEILVHNNLEGTKAFRQAMRALLDDALRQGLLERLRSWPPYEVYRRADPAAPHAHGDLPAAGPSPADGPPGPGAGVSQ